MLKGDRTKKMEGMIKVTVRTRAKPKIIRITYFFIVSVLNAQNKSSDIYSFLLFL